MKYKLVFNLILLVLSLELVFISIESVSAQTTLKEKNRAKDFGKSLKRFEKKGKDNSKNKEVNQENPKQNEVLDEETIRVETNLLINDVLVVNEKGNVILGLKQNDFIITEDKTPQKVELFSFGENAALPRSIVLIFSSGYHAPDNINNNIEAAKALVDKLSPQDKMAIVTPDQKLVLDFTQDKVLLKNTLHNLSKAKSNLVTNKEYGTLLAVLDEMFDERDVRPIVIFQTGGVEIFLLKLDENAQPTADFQKYQGIRNYGFSDVVEKIEKSRATIYSIIPEMRFVGRSREDQLKLAQTCVQEWMRQISGKQDLIRFFNVNEYRSKAIDDHVATQTAMMKVAKLSGGYAEFLETSEDAQRVYETIFKVINNRYTIGYYPTNQTRDGKRRQIKMEIRNHPEYIVVGRESYLAPKR